MAQRFDRFLLSPKGLAVRRVDHAGPLTEPERDWAAKFDALLLVPADQQLTDGDRQTITQTAQADATEEQLEKAERAGYMRGEREGYRIAEREFKPQITKAERERDAARRVSADLRKRLSEKVPSKTQITKDLKAAREAIQKFEVKAQAVQDVLGQLEGDGSKDRPWNYGALVQAVRIVKGLTK